MKKIFLFKQILIILSVLIILYGFGYIHNGDWKSILGASIVFYLSYVFALQNKYIFIVFGIMLSFLSLYFPTGIIYGPPNPVILVSLLNTQEMDIAIGYLKAIKWEISVTIVFIIIQSLFLFFKMDKNIKWLPCFMGSLYLALWGINGQYHFNNDAFLKAIVSSYQIFKETKESQSTIYDVEDLNVQLLKQENPQKVKIVIVGESVRPDYMSVYGYPYPTTPFLEKSNGVFLDGYTAVAPNTTESLNRTLFKANIDNDSIDWKFNIINLANQAGYNTYWISNQGRQGFGDDVIFQMAGLAKERHFLRKAEFHAGNYDDFDMLPILDSIIENSTEENKLVFLHMIGSHEPVCERILPDQLSFDINNEADCYIATIEKLDIFIKTIVEQLQQKNIEYELLYFSDHGLFVAEDRVFHSKDIYESFTIPMFILGSNIKQHTVVTKQINAIHFLDLFAQFLNIGHERLDPRYNIYDLSNVDSDSDPVVFWNQYMPILSFTKQQPVVLPSIDSRGKEKTVVEQIIISNSCQAYVDGATRIGDAVIVKGWMADEGSKLPIKGQMGVAYQQDNLTYFFETKSHSRSSIADFFGITAIPDDNYGFWGKVKMPKNNEDLYLSYLRDNNEAVLCLNKPINIEIKSSPVRVESFEMTDQCHVYIDESNMNNEELTLKGWIAQKNTNLPISGKIGVTYKLEGQMYFDEIMRKTRQDVAEYYGIKNIANISYGFEYQENIDKNAKDFHLSYITKEKVFICSGYTI